MAEQVVDEKSDDLDIVSTGKLYQGPWEKKYWSSSRGKDRHPYPVGYVAHRTYNGNTYKMAILEGLKGPEFAISSTDGESCSGQTPDIAWEGFQKKSCVRIKFWRGKRFSCKIDGAELFGFKNPHVARLLRGLKANASPFAEQSELTQSHEHHTQGTVHSSETCKDPDLQVKLVKSKTEGKETRSKKRKEVHVKSVSGTQHKRERPQDLLSAKEGLKLDSSISSENLEKEKCLDVLETSNPIGSKDLIAEEGINLLKSQENLDVSFTSSKTADEKGNPPVQKGSQILDDVDLYAPDTLDPALDEKRGPQVKKDSQMLEDVDLCAPDTLDPALDCSVNEKLNSAQILVSEKCATQSQSKDDTVIGTGSDNSYRSDSDSVGQEITNSMMTLLLPRALPLLKTYSRKKKKNVYKNTDKLFTENTEFGKQNENASGLEDSAAIAPDSFENHQCEGDNIQPSEQVWDVGETMSKMKSNRDVDLVFEKSLQTGGNIIPSRKDPELTNEEVKDESTLNKSHNDDLQNVFELVGCYVHPTPISMVMLRTKGNEVFICVLCGYLMEKDKTLFIYKTFIQGEKRGHPSFIGHTKIISPISKNKSGDQGDQIMQFTPDGKSLVLLNNIKAPCCREGSVKCQFSACTPDCFEKNAVKIVQVKIGYVHVVCKFKTTNNVCCILVCEPNYLLAAEENGRINLWTMNSTWSAATEHIHLPTSDCMPNHIIQMKKIPNSPALVVGHTSFGEFCLWDLTRKILVSKFSAPGTSFLHFLPINLFRFPKGGCMEETQIWSLQTDNHEDMSLVLLVSSHDLNNQHPYKDAGCWSLALLAKNKLILLNALDPSCTVAGASAGYGMIGTCDGSLYIWELSTGTKLGYLSHSTGATVSCLVADESDSGAFAVAVDGSQLQVYARIKNHQ